MGMGIDQISNSSLLNQLEQMNRQMNAMAQSAGSFAVGRDQAAFAHNFNAANQNAFDGSKAVRAFNEQATASISGAINPNVVNGNTNGAAQIAPTASQGVGEFKQLLKDAFENVNVLQNEAGSLATRFDLGDRSVTLADVMIASQKSSLSFEATLQIRNKLVDAYQSIMQMQI